VDFRHGSDATLLRGTTHSGTGAISAVLDAYPYLIVRVLGQGLFSPGNADGHSSVDVTARTGAGRVEIN
jgi:hypothetical protein